MGKNTHCVATLLPVLLSLHVVNSYILLTANIEDVHAIAKQIAASPVANQLNKIIRRASNIFNQQVNNQEVDSSNPHLRSKSVQNKELDSDKSEGDNFEVWQPQTKDEDLREKGSSDSEASETSAESNNIKNRQVERRLASDPKSVKRQVHADQGEKNLELDPDLVELGKNASFYLTSIKKIFESV